MPENKKKKFPQAKLDSEINVRFLLNEDGDLYFLLHNNSVHIFLLKLKENWKKISEGNRYPVMQIMTAKITTLQTLYVHVVSNRAMIPQILYDIVLYARHFPPVKFFFFFFQSITFINYVSSYRKM